MSPETSSSSGPAPPASPRPTSSSRPASRSRARGARPRRRAAVDRRRSTARCSRSAASGSRPTRTRSSRRSRDLGLETYSRYREGDSVYIGPDGERTASRGRSSRSRRDRSARSPGSRAARRDGRRDRPRPAVGAREGRGVGHDLVRRTGCGADRRRRGAATSPSPPVGDAHQADARVLAAAVAAHGRIRRQLLAPRRRRLHPRQARGRRPAAGAAPARRAARRRRLPRPAGAHAGVGRRQAGVTGDDRRHDVRAPRTRSSPMRRCSTAASVRRRRCRAASTSCTSTSRWAS